MDVFRLKKSRDSATKSKAQETSFGTLDSLHQNVVSDMKDTSTNIEDIRKRASDIEEELENLSEVYKATKLSEELRNIRKKLEQKDPLRDYYTENADIIMKYYGEADRVQSVSMTPADQNTFVKYLVAAQPQENPAVSKKKLFEEYMSRMKMTTTTDSADQSNCNSEHCDRCNVAREEWSEEGILVCPKCGSEEHMMVVSDFPSFRDPPKERNNYAYKKINHLNEILNQFQAKESTIIPDEVMNEVILEIKKRRIQNIAELTEKDMREILKKLNRSKYYEHATHILSRLNGNPPPTITPEIEEKIRSMFQEIQAPFLLYCPDDRTNFLSYSYILYKFFELIELDEYKVYFPLLKSRDRLISHDIIWKQICDYLKWEFIASV